jgi:type VI secretion system Hcp family effector
MAIYMHVDGVKGNVTSKQHHHWIQLQSINWQVAKKAINDVGRVALRSFNAPLFSPFLITKKIDNASALLFEKSCEQQKTFKILIHVLQASASGMPFLEYELDGVIIGEFEHLLSGDSHVDDLLETMALYFHHFKMRYIPRDAMHQATSPFTAGYDLKKMESL